MGWQCLGNDFTPQCAPRAEEQTLASATPVPKVANANTQAAMRDVEEADGAHLEISAAFVNDTVHVQKCKCGPGSGDPDSCCSKCKPSKDPHNVPHCPGGGKNTGPFCGNDFHVTEPNACYGETPLCCTNDMGIPVCCKLGQVCHSPLVGNNECRDADDLLVV